MDPDSGITDHGPHAVGNRRHTVARVDAKVHQRAGMLGQNVVLNATLKQGRRRGSPQQRVGGVLFRQPGLHERAEQPLIGERQALFSSPRLF